MVLLGYWVLWKEHGRELTIKKFKYYYYSYLLGDSKGWYHFKPYDNHIRIDQLLDNNKGWNESLFTVIDDSDISSFNLPSTFGKYKRKVGFLRLIPLL